MAPVRYHLRMSQNTDYSLVKADAWAQFMQTKSDQQLRIPHPVLEEPAPADAAHIALPAAQSMTLGNMSVREAIARRQSRRQFTEEPLSLEELAYLCWATQGVREVAASGVATLRTVPSGGARHPYETYLVVRNVAGVEPGLYRYLALSHELCLLRAGDLTEEALAGCNGQRMAAACAVLFCWVAVPYRAEWRYPIVAPKLIAQDSGHICQNLYLACESIGCGTCAIGAYNQPAMDSFLGVDGEHMFAVYAAPVGKAVPEPG
jgi:SagB-type dehydrogenase family enzyme